jgi:rhodanese-related sulfurtransferase
MRGITRDELRALLDAGDAVLVEALPRPHYDAGHLPGAVNVPEALTAGTAAALAPDRAATVVVYCSGAGCGRSRVTAAAFDRLGYADVRVYKGGKRDWADAGLPLYGTRHTAAGARGTSG